MSRFEIHPDTRLGPVHYRVANLDRVAGFYRDVLGFAVLDSSGSSAVLGAGETPLLKLTERRDARRYPRRTGLYHTAFLVPTRRELAHLVRQIAEARAPVHGTSNHGTHLAIYLPDPEENGIELAWDFPREQWPMRDGKLVLSDMRRGGVDLGELMDVLERDTRPWTGLDSQTRVGHVHLHVSDLSDSERFYHGLMGFGVTMKSAQFGGLFVSAGGYHHHIGMNIWLGAGAPPPPEDAMGLVEYTVTFPSESEREKVITRLREGGVEVELDEHGPLVRDPSKIGIRLSVSSS